MEINFQTHHHHEEANSVKKVSKFIKGRKRSNSNSKKFVGVRQRSSGKWIAEIKDTTHKKIRMWLGTFETAEDAARAYDEAACLLRGSNTRTNFVTNRVSADSQLAYRIRKLLDSKKIGKQNKQGNSAVFASTCIVDSVSIEKIQESHEKVLQDSCDDDNLYKPTTTTTTMTQSRTSSDRLYEKVLNSCDDDNNLYKPTTITTTATQSQTSCDRLCESSSEANNDDDLYKPDMMSCSSSSTSQAEVSWGFEFAEELLDFRIMDESTSEMGCTEFERMKVERQISASLYAVNGVQEYMENVHDVDDLSLWDLPPLCSLLS